MAIPFGSSAATSENTVNAGAAEVVGLDSDFCGTSEVLSEKIAKAPAAGAGADSMLLSTLTAADSFAVVDLAEPILAAGALDILSVALFRLSSLTSGLVSTVLTGSGLLESLASAGSDALCLLSGLLAILSESVTEV
jgi:hypothetical protein